MDPPSEDIVRPTESQMPRRPRISYACEACRAAKVKCQPSNQGGICRRCSESKRECIFKTGPRTRRPRQSKFASTTAATLPPIPPVPGPSKTFTIDIPMPDDGDDLAASLQTLKCSHEMYVADLLPGGESPYSYSDEEDEPPSPQQTRSTAGSSSVSHASSLPVGASAFSTPPSSLAHPSSKAGRSSLASLGVRPQFNLDSAEKLLADFENQMLLYFPAVALRRASRSSDLTDIGPLSISALASTKPFVLLAMLAAASGSRTLQGHSLYDDEFRKILGLKFVAGGERSMELLQGLVVYTAWYPFHLRPKNKQAFQYIRMVVDIVTDLELDQDPDTDDSSLSSHPASEQRLEQIRTYLSTYFLTTNFATAWNRTPMQYYTKYTAKCCGILERHSVLKGDHVLAWLIRMQHIMEEVNDLRKTHRAGNQSENQIDLMLKGMESQIVEWENRMPVGVASTTSLRISLLFTKIFIPAAPLLKLPNQNRSSSSSSRPPSSTPFTVTSHRLKSLIPTLTHLFDLFLSLPPSELNSFAGPQWVQLILLVILGFRLSFPLADCPEWDDVRARAEMGYGLYLDRLCSLGDGEKTGGQQGNMDVLTASKAVFRVVKKKWERRVGRMGKGKRIPVTRQQQKQQQTHPGTFPQVEMAAIPGLHDLGMDHTVLDKTMQGCPMLDGSMDAYFPVWDETFSSATGSAGIGNMLAGGTAMGVGGVDNSGAVGAENGVLPGGGNGYVDDLWGTLTAGWAHWPQPGTDFGGDLP